MAAFILRDSCSDIHRNDVLQAIEAQQNVPEIGPPIEWGTPFEQATPSHRKYPPTDKSAHIFSWVAVNSCDYERKRRLADVCFFHSASPAALTSLERDEPSPSPGIANHRRVGAELRIKGDTSGGPGNVDRPYPCAHRAGMDGGDFARVNSHCNQSLDHRLHRRC